MYIHHYLRMDSVYKLIENICIRDILVCINRLTSCISFLNKDRRNDEKNNRIETVDHSKRYYQMNTFKLYSYLYLKQNILGHYVSQ